MVKKHQSWLYPLEMAHLHQKHHQAVSVLWSSIGSFKQYRFSEAVSVLWSSISSFKQYQFSQAVSVLSSSIGSLKQYRFSTSTQDFRIRQMSAINKLLEFVVKDELKSGKYRKLILKIPIYIDIRIQTELLPYLDSFNWKHAILSYKYWRNQMEFFYYSNI